MRGFPGGTVLESPPTNAGDIGDAGLIPGSGGSPGGGHGNPLQYSCLDSPMAGGARWTPGAHGVAELDAAEHTQHTRGADGGPWQLVVDPGHNPPVLPATPLHTQVLSEALCL